MSGQKMGTETDASQQGNAHLLNPLCQWGAAEGKNAVEAVSGLRADSREAFQIWCEEQAKGPQVTECHS